MVKRELSHRKKKKNNKFNKNVILLSLREMTNLSTKEIRSSIKRFKKLYILIQSKMKTD